MYLRSAGGEVMPVVLDSRGTNRDAFVRSNPVVIERQKAPSNPKRRSWEREVLIVGGSAGAGAAIGAAAAGGKGAAVGALSGGVAGLVYDLATRK